MMNGLAGRKKSEPIARKRESKKTPTGPRAPIQVQRLCSAGTTGKKNEVAAKPIARAPAIVSFLANEVTNVGRDAAASAEPPKPLVVDFYFTI